MSKAITPRHDSNRTYSVSLLQSAAALWGEDFWGGAKPRPVRKRPAS